MMLPKPSSCEGCPLFCQPHGKQLGYVPASGTGSNGVLIVLEAAGEDEERAGMPVVGRAGQFMWQHLGSVGIEREGFRIHNVLSCRPPDNKLLKMPYTEAAIAHCSPNLDNTIRDHVLHCNDIGRTPVIVALGKFAFKRLMGIESDKHPIMLADYQTYPHWLEQYQCWLMAAPHPSHIMQGKNNLVPTMVFVFQRALEVAKDGIELYEPTYLLDPSPVQFKGWVDEYFRVLKAHPETYLSYDIETPYKSGKDESEVAREDDDDYVILRCAYSYNLPDGSTVSCSVQWFPEFMAEHERLFAADGQGVNWNGTGYDDVRIRAQVPMNLISLDAMLAWHVLNTSLPKGLGYVTPFYVRNASMWKHMASIEGQEAFYNAKDADMALRNWLGIRNDLKDNQLWEVFERHVVQLNKVLTYMSGQGVLLDRAARQSAEDKLQGLLAEIWDRMQAAVPIEARSLKVYKKEPKDTHGLVRTASTRRATRCPVCQSLDVRAEHFKSVGKKRLKAGATENPCSGFKAVKVEIPDLLWAEPLDFKISKLSLTRYQQLRKHQPYKDRKTKQVTFDVKAMKQLMVKYPDDKLYPIILEYRKIQKLASTYVGVTKYKEVVVPIDYKLSAGEYLKADYEALHQGRDQDSQGWEDKDDVLAQPINAEASESGAESPEPTTPC
jgi:uracil-DNA glycosylase family 4